MDTVGGMARPVACWPASCLKPFVGGSGGYLKPGTPRVVAWVAFKGSAFKNLWLNIGNCDDDQVPKQQCSWSYFRAIMGQCCSMDSRPRHSRLVRGSTVHAKPLQPCRFQATPTCSYLGFARGPWVQLCVEQPLRNSHHFDASGAIACGNLRCSVQWNVQNKAHW